MMRKFALSTSLAVLCAGVAAGAQGTGAGQQPPSQPTSTPAMAQESATTVEGCVYREQDIPGRAPNVAERAGVLEDYILVTSAPKAGGAVGTSGTTPTTPPSATPGAMTMAKMFKLEHASDNQLSAMVGKRVRVTGKAAAEDKTATGAPKQDKVPGNPDSIEIPEFEVASITSIAGECPAKPAIHK